MVFNLLLSTPTQPYLHYYRSPLLSTTLCPHHARLLQLDHHRLEAEQQSQRQPQQHPLQTSPDHISCGDLPPGAQGPLYPPRLNTLGPTPTATTPSKPQQCRRSTLATPASHDPSQRTHLRPTQSCLIPSNQVQNTHP